MTLGAPPSAQLRSWISAYVHCEARCSETLHRPVPARTAPVLEFTFGTPYRVHRHDHATIESAHRIAVIGSQTYRRVHLELNGKVESFVVIFQPGATESLLSIPPAELINQHFDAEAVVGRSLSQLAEELSESGSFAGRIAVANRFFASRTGGAPGSPAIRIARAILREQGCVRIGDLAAQSGLSIRQLERRFTAAIGVPPKVFARIARFEAALQAGARAPQRSWTGIAHDLGYFDQMHMVREFRLLSGESPTNMAAMAEPFSSQPVRADA